MHRELRPVLRRVAGAAGDAQGAPAGPRTRFVSWSGACAGSSPTCSLDLTADASVSAVFAPATVQLSVSTTGRGKVTSTPRGVSCPSRCRATFAIDAVVRLRAAPRKAWRFAGWRGACRERAGAASRSRRTARCGPSSARLLVVDEAPLRRAEERARRRRPRLVRRERARVALARHRAARRVLRLRGQEAVLQLGFNINVLRHGQAIASITGRTAGRIPRRERHLRPDRRGARSASFARGTSSTPRREPSTSSSGARKARWSSPRRARTPAARHRLSGVGGGRAARRERRAVRRRSRRRRTRARRHEWAPYEEGWLPDYERFQSRMTAASRS